ncbi:hypothetical protein FACS189415_0180 [Bacteroidia bacterium]|nr:hypothetical protein FACS189426_14600 [Bacteroidia bacterium]GHU81584.1 hypothetical protein FACS189415_0180 [Bacteroidia bacterium]GHV70634.1 hypothetical protein FACS189420_2530 [Bacteroidia bacterium]
MEYAHTSQLQEKLGTLNCLQPDYENEDYCDWVMVRRKGVAKLRINYELF